MNTHSEARASALSGPVSGNAPGPVALHQGESYWYGRGLAVNGGYIGGERVACFRRHDFNKAGCWCVDFTARGFYVSMDAVVDDFGSLVRV